MPGLNDLHAMQLFCWHAFLQPFPLSGFEILVEGFLNACNGLPLSLKVLGGQLHGKKSKDYWQSQLDKILRILPADIIQRLQVSFDALDKEEQEMFLDVACFLIDEEKSLAIALWDGSGWSGLHGLETLVNKCLVELISDDYEHTETIWMHNHLSDMGRKIATTHSPCRYWSSQQILNIQKHSEERTPIRGISTEILNSQFFLKKFVGSSRRGFKRLRSSLGSEILLVSGNEFTEEVASLSEDLVWLRWKSFPHRNLPSRVPLTSLTVLQIYSSDLKELWGNNVEPPLKLIELNITSSSNLKRFPTSIGRLKHLKKIFFNQSIQCSSLPQAFCDLRSLEHLEFRNFNNLSSLPARFGEFTNLRHISLSYCEELKRLPASFKHLIHLEFLDLSGCKKLKLRSDMLENITKLEHLNLHCCEELEKLPSQITNQMSLKMLFADETSLRYLPKDIGVLRKLNSLSIGSNLLTRLPASLGNLSCLTDLDIQIPLLRTFPAFLEKLSTLTSLSLESSLLTSLPISLGNLSCLVHLLIGCPLLTSLPTSLGNLSSLISFRLFNCKNLEYIPHCIWGLKLLGRVEVKYSGIRELPFGAGKFALHKLKFIELYETGLSEISISEDCCPNLKNLIIREHTQLIEIGILPTSIDSISLSDCKMLKNIRGIGGVVNLRELYISACWELDELPTFAYLTRLKIFKMTDCPKVSRIEGFQHCRSLEELEAKTSWESPGIQSLEVMERLKNLRISCHTMSALKPCVRSMKECPCRMEIEGRVFHFVQPILNSLEFPDLRVMEWEEVFDLNKLILYFPNFVCYLEEDDFEDEQEEDKEVHIAVFRQAPDYVVRDYFRLRSEEYLNFCDSKAMVVAGEEAKVVEAFYKIFALLE